MLFHSKNFLVKMREKPFVMSKRKQNTSNKKSWKEEYDHIEKQNFKNKK